MVSGSRSEPVDDVGGEREVAMQSEIGTVLARWHGLASVTALALSLFVGARSLAGDCTVTPSPYWKTTIAFPDDPFRYWGTSEGGPGWVKFTVLTCDPTTVYFQDSNAYRFHYEFATEQLDPFLGISPTDLDQITLYAEGQQAILGAVIIPSPWGSPFPEYGIQLVRNDPYDPQTVVDVFDLVRSSVNADPGVQAFYFPTFEQLQSAEENQAFLESHGIQISSPDRWATGNSCYAHGWALGDLKYFEGSAIQGAYLMGMLGPEDILLTDGVPAEVPPLAGLMTLAPSTPNSHVAILAQTFQIPFVHLLLPADAARAQKLVGRRVVLRAFPGIFGGCSVRLIDVQEVLTSQQIAEILALKDPPVLSIFPVTTYGAYDASTDGLVPSDIQYFGGKASNFGFLRRSIPDSTPVAAAISFDLWNEFLDQTLAGGETLRDEISSLLSKYSYPPSDMFALSSDLSAIRHLLFEDASVTDFTPAQESAIIAILQDSQYGFDINKKIRFRSSTNVEDSEQFTGAGLYDSFSGCLADDLDGDESGPSICDATKPTERGVFRAIRRVFASFYNENAFLERLKYNINAVDVGMALLVHHSFPDEIELANGVATLDYSARGEFIDMVTQLGAVSVANPVDGSIPEEVDVSVYTSGTYVYLRQGSNLVLLGATVMEWDQDYRDLAQLMVSAADQFALETGKTSFVLDFEFKKVAPGGGALPGGGLVVKQLREIPQADTTPSITPFLINEPTEYCVLQGEEVSDDPLAIHRLKSRWALESESYRMTEENLLSGLHTQIHLEHLDGCSLRTRAGLISSWPAFEFAFDGDTAVDQWMFDDTWIGQSYDLTTSYIDLLVAPSESPLLTLRDLGWYLGQDNLGYGCMELSVFYDTPVPSLRWSGSQTTTLDNVALCPCADETVADILQERTIEGPDGLLISTSFYWPPPPPLVAGYTAPLARWEETVIEGLTSAPIVLHGEYSQTYFPLHHNFGEHFVFDPFLDPDVPQYLLDELRGDNIRLIHAFQEFEHEETTLFGHDGSCDEPEQIPAASAWGLAALALSVLTAGTLAIRRAKVRPW